MIDLSRNGYTHSEIEKVLHAKDGKRKVRFQAEIYRNGVPIDTIPISGSISYRSEDSIKRTAQFSIPGEVQTINWLVDRIKPFMIFSMPDGGEVSFSLGMFIPSSPQKIVTQECTTFEVEAYDLSVILKEDCLIDRLYFSAGSKYLEAIQHLLGDIRDPIFIEEDSATFPSDREFDIGESKLNILNTLLDEINYNTLFINSEGSFVISRYQQPSSNNITYAYNANSLSVIALDAMLQSDSYGIPNTFIAVLSNPELEDLRAIYINSNPESPLSTIRRGRTIVSEIQRPDMVANRDQLNAYVQRMAFEQSQVYESITFQTAVMPFHENNNILYINHPDVNGIFTETSWRFSLEAGSTMEHTGRRLIQI